VSVVLVLVANLAVRYSKNPISVTLGWTVGIMFLPTLAGAFLPAVAIQLAILFTGIMICGASGQRRWISALSVASLLIPYSVVPFIPNEKVEIYEHFRAKYPLESLEARLPHAVPASVGGDPERLVSLEKTLEWETPMNRMYVLRQLHDGTMSRFVTAPGFGVLRTVRLSVPSEQNLNLEPRNEAPPQPDYFRIASTDVNSWPARPTKVALDRLHATSFLDFVNPMGFGFVKDRQHVAGFQSHGFSGVPTFNHEPKPAVEWKVASVELVGLLLHDEPRVYISAKLPKMDELRDAPTRQLDPFEAAALTALRSGADMHTADGPDGIRFVGAIRSTKQCVECHGGERGALLGAFSYRLQPSQR